MSNRLLEQYGRKPEAREAAMKLVAELREIWPKFPKESITGEDVTQGPVIKQITGYDWKEIEEAIG